MKLQTLSLCLAVTLALASSSCSSPKAVSNSNKKSVNKKVEELQAQISSLRFILYDMRVAVEPEPSEDVSDGLFFGRIVQVESGTRTPVLVVDFITPEMAPSVSKEQRERSSWPDVFGWNKMKHRQRIPVYESAEFVIGGTVRFHSVSQKEFVHALKSHKEGGSILKYYIALEDQEIIAIWPWVP